MNKTESETNSVLRSKYLMQHTSVIDRGDIKYTAHKLLWDYTLNELLEELF